MNLSQRLGLWLALILPAILTVYAIVHGKLFDQAIWTPGGLRRFAIFAAGYALFFTACSLVRPARFAAAMWTGVLVYTVAAAGLAAVLSVALFLLSSLVLGHAILEGRDAAPVRSAAAGVQAMLLGLSIYMLAIGATAILPVHYRWVYAGAFLIPLGVNHRLTARWLGRARELFRPLPPDGAAARLALGALVFVLLTHWLTALGPETSADGLAMHLVVPSAVAQFHRWGFDVADHVWAVMPAGADWCFTAVYLTGGEAAARLLNFCFLGAIVILLTSLMRRRLPDSAAYLAAALFAATPLVQLVSGSLFVENLWALLALASVAAFAGYLDERSPRHLFLAFILLGAAAATKFGALGLAAPMAGVLLWSTWRDPDRRAAGVRACCAMACLAAFAAPPYLMAYAKTGNPVFPFLNAVFRSPYLDTKVSIANPDFKTPLAATTPYDLTFHSSRFVEGQDGAAGFQYFLLLPLAAISIRRGWPRAALLAAAVLPPFFIAVFLAQSNLRYLYAAMPLATLAIAAGLGEVREGAAWLWRAACAAGVAALALNLYFLPSAGWQHKDFLANPASAAARSDYLRRYAPVRALVDYLNAKHPGAPVAFAGTMDIAGLRGRAYGDSWHTTEFNRGLLAAGSEQDCLRLLEERGIELLVAPAPAGATETPILALQRFIARCTETELAGTPFYVARLRPRHACEPSPPVTTAFPGHYNNRDPHLVYTGPWLSSRFAGAAGDYLTYSRVPGAAFRLTFTGSGVTYVYTKAFNRGIVEVTLDGVRQGELDQYAPSIQWQSSKDFACAGPGVHTLEVRGTGRKSAAARDAYVDVDQLIVR